ncbi:hypothetical protein E4U41_007493 [Claviceps citrina]|nr:hypothetical protein E4U41_007493 [Claviceps citrina]
MVLLPRAALDPAATDGIGTVASYATLVGLIGLGLLALYSAYRYCWPRLRARRKAPPPGGAKDPPGMGGDDDPRGGPDGSRAATRVPRPAGPGICCNLRSQQ